MLIFAPKKDMQRETQLIGREYESQILRNYLQSPKAELVAVYGRRRVGKTFLVKHILGDDVDFYFTGMYDTPRALQLLQFQKELARFSGKSAGKLKDWFSAFDALRDYLKSLKKERIIIFLDELPWMDTPRSNFLSAFSYFWNMWASDQSRLKLIVCGSATTWMLDKLVGDKGGLYGRVCRSIYLAPFTLHETELFLRELKGMELNRFQVLETYMILGGIPYYLDMLEKGIPMSRNIDRLLFHYQAPLRVEYDFLFRSLFKESNIYRRVVETLSGKLKGMTRADIIASAKLPEGGNMTEVLDNLCKCDFLRKYSAIGKTERDTMYQLADLFSLFHLRFVADNHGQDENLWTNMLLSPQKASWSGYAFEQVCLHHLPEIKQSLGITGVLSNAHSWQCKPFVDSDGTAWKGGQIDLLIDRNDGVVNLCEMKFCHDKYALTKEYEEHLRYRASLFRQATGSKKALTHTFVTTYGLRQNSHSGIVQSEVTMDDLFQQRRRG